MQPKISEIAGQRKIGIRDPSQNNFTVPIIQLFVRNLNSIYFPQFSWHD